MPFLFRLDLGQIYTSVKPPYIYIRLAYTTNSHISNLHGVAFIVMSFLFQLHPSQIYETPCPLDVPISHLSIQQNKNGLSDPKRQKSDSDAGILNYGGIY
jgi:hypothetical protein